ncbi:MAG: polyphosphate:AMP phosphotransferase, partial [Myxococcales bacterium]|nr:polyphosphate:AMP phosphotransferase [Myxococcales bacterium]
NRLSKWLDTRGLQVHAFWDTTDDEAQRPRYWRYWQRLPPRGSIGIMLGSWYTQPLVDRVYERIDDADFDRELRRIEEFERLLTDDGALLVKFWFHLPRGEQKKRLRRDEKQGHKPAPSLQKFAKRYDRFSSFGERALRMTDTGHCPWYVIESTDPRYRDLTAGKTLLQAIQQRLEQPPPPRLPRGGHQTSVIEVPEASISVLDRVDLDATLEPADYAEQLTQYQQRLSRLAWKAYERQRHTVAVFEGWDAAGKGGAIRRVTQAVDGRLYRTISIAAPTDEERAHHYLWRFWRHLPRAGRMTIYDRSWYGRVLVERVEGFARPAEWQRAYQEINDFEEQLCEHGVVLLKFWVHISPEEQLRRFHEREQIEYKRHKITDEDWRNRDKWPQYEAAVNDMVARTSTAYAPWTLVAGNDKKFARVRVLQTFCERLSAALGDD